MLNDIKYCKTTLQWESRYFTVVQAVVVVLSLSVFDKSGGSTRSIINLPVSGGSEFAFP